MLYSYCHIYSAVVVYYCYIVYVTADIVSCEAVLCQEYFVHVLLTVYL